MQHLGDDFVAIPLGRIHKKNSSLLHVTFSPLLDDFSGIYKPFFDDGGHIMMILRTENLQPMPFSLRHAAIIILHTSTVTPSLIITNVILSIC